MTISSSLKRLFVALAAISLVAAGYFTTSIPQAKALTSLSSVTPGSLIRGETFPAVYYYGEDGLRYVFTNDKAYFTWYSNFSSVKFISDADLQTIQIGGNVTYKPGVKMIKIDTDSKTYAVAKGGVLRHVTSESIATSLYGSDWNKKIDDVPDSFFTNYTIGSPINSTNEYSPASASAGIADIGDDKNLMAPEVITITSGGYSPVDVHIEVGQGVKFVNNDSGKHTATSDDLKWGTGTLMQGQSFIRVFKEAGTYGFFDSYNSAFTGAIYVE